MTAGPNERTGATGAGTGAVFDIGYQRYTGIREGRNRARLAVYKDGVRNALGIGRETRTKVLPGLFIALLLVIAMGMAMAAGAAQRLIGPEGPSQLDLPSHSDYYGIASIIIFVFGAVVGPEMLCPDRRNGTINLYLVRPLTGSDYVLARWAAFVSVMSIVVWLPQLVLLVGLMMGGPDPFQYLSEHWLDLPRLLLSGAAMAAYTTTLALLTASFTTRRAYASVFLVGLFVITTPFTTGLASEIGGAAGRWISMFNLSNIPVHVNDLIFGEVSSVTSVAPARELSASILIGWYLLWTVVPGAVLWLRYRRMTP
jgi:ABC-2 type transport system permease protein